MRTSAVTLTEWRQGAGSGIEGTHRPSYSDADVTVQESSNARCATAVCQS